MPIILGIDPGVTGAMAYLNTETSTVARCIDHSEWCNQHEAPDALLFLLRNHWLPDIVVLEEQHARPNFRVGLDGVKKVVQGIASTWNYAEHYGIIRGVLACLDRKVHRVDPGTWKGNMHLPGGKKNKNVSLDKARVLWPDSLWMFKRQLDHGRAEAALLAEYGRRFLPLKRRFEL